MSQGRVWITRTEPGAARTAQTVTALGFEAVVASVLGVRHLKPIIDPHGFDALIVTSANALDAFCALCSRRAVSVWCVGEASAAAAHRQGFQQVISAGGDAQALADTIRGAVDKRLRLLHPRGRDIAWPLADVLRSEGFTVGEATVYETAPLLPNLSNPQTLTHVLIHSPRAAAPAVQTLDRLNPAVIPDVAWITISSAAADALNQALAQSVHLQNLAQRIRISAFPDEASMLKQL